MMGLPKSSPFVFHCCVCLLLSFEMGQAWAANEDNRPVQQPVSVIHGLDPLRVQNAIVQDVSQIAQTEQADRAWLQSLDTLGCVLPMNPANPASSDSTGNSTGNLADDLASNSLAKPNALHTGANRVLDTLTLSDVIAATLCRSTQIQSARVQVEARATELGMARSAYLPVVSGSYNRVRNIIEYPNSSTQVAPYWGSTTYLSLAWRLFDFGGRSAGAHSARLMVGSSVATYQATVRTAISEVVQTYFNLLSAQASLDLQTELEKRAVQTMTLTLRKEHAGTASMGETLQASVLLSQVRIELQRARVAYEQYESMLKRQAGIDNHEPLHLPQLDNVEQIKRSNALPPLDTLLSQVTKHPYVQSYAQKLSAAQEQVRATRSEGLPSVDFGANFYQDGYPGQSVSTIRSNTTTLGVTLNVPIFSGFKQYYKIKNTQTQVTQAQIELSEAQAKVREDIRNAHHTLTAAHTNLQTALEMQRSAQNLLKSAEKLYVNRAIDVFDLIKAQNTWAQAQQECTRTVAQWESARWQLATVLGHF